MKREQGEGSLTEPRMRDGEPRRLDDDAGDPQHIEVEGPCPPARSDAPHAACRSLDLEERIENHQYIPLRSKPYGGVQVVGLRRPDRSRLVDRRSRRDNESLLEGANGASHEGEAIAEVRAEPDHDVQAEVGRASQGDDDCSSNGSESSPG